MSDLYLCVDQDGWTGGYQLSTQDETGGYRIAGPKFNGSSKSIIKHRLSERDAQELRSALDAAFPTKTKDS